MSQIKTWCQISTFSKTFKFYNHKIPDIASILTGFSKLSQAPHTWTTWTMEFTRWILSIIRTWTWKWTGVSTIRARKCKTTARITKLRKTETRGYPNFVIYYFVYRFFCFLWTIMFKKKIFLKHQMIFFFIWKKQIITKLDQIWMYFWVRRLTKNQNSIIKTQFCVLLFSYLNRVQSWSLLSPSKF